MTQNRLVRAINDAPLDKMSEGFDTNINVRLPGSLLLLLDAVAAFATVRGVRTTRSDIIRDALDAYLHEVQEAFPPEDLRNVRKPGDLSEANDLARAREAVHGPHRPLDESIADLDARRVTVRSFDELADKVRAEPGAADMIAVERAKALAEQKSSSAGSDTP